MMKKFRRKCFDKFCFGTVNYTTMRHFVLPGSGDLLVSAVGYRDTKHRYRCQVRHQLTNQRLTAATWASIKLRGMDERAFDTTRP